MQVILFPAQGAPEFDPEPQVLGSEAEPAVLQGTMFDPCHLETLSAGHRKPRAVSAKK